MYARVGVRPDGSDRRARRGYGANSRIARNAAVRRGKARGPYRIQTRPPNAVPFDVVDYLQGDRARPYTYLLGLYLGDGHIAAPNRLDIYLDARFGDLVESCLSAMRMVHPRNRAAMRHKSTGCTVVYSYAWQWRRLIPQHGPGLKHKRPILLADWQLDFVRLFPFDLLRGLLESDGSRFDRRVGGKTYPAYDFTNESADIRAIFCSVADSVGVHYTLPKPNAISIARRADVSILDAQLPIKA